MINCLIRKVSIVSLAPIVLLVSCNSDDKCKGFPDKLERITEATPKLTDYQETVSLQNAVSLINRCYERASYANIGYEISLERIAKGNDGYYYIFFSFIHISDSWIVFKVRQNGVIEAAFNYSPLSRFAAPG